jgi:hypothetical protein
VSAGLVTGVAGGSSQITASISLVAPGVKAFGCGGCPGQQDMEAGAAANGVNPAYVGVVSPKTQTGSIRCGSSTFYARYLQVYYQVLDLSKSPIQQQDMTVAEHLSWTSSTCSTSNGCGQEPSPATWTTDNTGTITQPDTVYNCSSTCIGGGSCTENWQQTFTVGGKSVGIVNGSVTGTLNCVSTGCTYTPQATTH